MKNILSSALILCVTISIAQPSQSARTAVGAYIVPNGNGSVTATKLASVFNKTLDAIDSGYNRSLDSLSLAPTKDTLNIWRAHAIRFSLPLAQSPTKIIGLATSTTFQVPANTTMSSIVVTYVSGNATLKIGTSPNGNELLEDSNCNPSQKTVIEQYFPSGQLIYFTFMGAGIFNIRIDQTNNYF